VMDEGSPFSIRCGGRHPLDRRVIDLASRLPHQLPDSEGMAEPIRSATD